MAETNDEAIQAVLADESTPKPLRDAYAALQQQLNEAKAESAIVKREAAFAKAGLKDVPHRSLFEKSYEGELNPEAIQEAAKEYGLVEDIAAADQTRADLEAHRRIGAAGSSVPSAPDDAMAALDRAGNNPEAIKRVIEQFGPELGVGLPPSAQGYRVV